MGGGRDQDIYRDRMSHYDVIVSDLAVFCGTRVTLVSIFLGTGLP